MPLEILTRDRGSGHTLDTCPPCRECSLSGRWTVWIFSRRSYVFAFFLFSFFFFTEEAGRRPNAKWRTVEHGEDSWSWFILGARVPRIQIQRRLLSLFFFLSRLIYTYILSASNRTLSVPSNADVEKHDYAIYNHYWIIYGQSQKSLWAIICRHTNNHRDEVNSLVWIVTMFPWIEQIPFDAKWISIYSI